MVVKNFWKSQKMDIKKLAIIRRVLQAITAVVIVSLIPLGAIVPWSNEVVVEDFGYYGHIYTIYHYNTSIALVYFIPAVSLVVTNKGVKNYLWRVRAETRSICIICGKSNDYRREFCEYCGNQLKSLKLAPFASNESNK